MTTPLPAGPSRYPDPDALCCSRVKGAVSPSAVPDALGQAIPLHWLPRTGRSTPPASVGEGARPSLRHYPGPSKPR